MKPGALAARIAAAAAAVACISLLAGKPSASPLANAPLPAEPVEGDRILLPAQQARQVTLPGGRKKEIKSVLNVRDRLRHGEYVWDDEGVEPGPIWVLADLSSQTLSVFRGGHEIGTAVILYGADEKPTPGGRFPILEKREHHRSNLYDAPMPYTLRLTMDGVAIHGSDVRNGMGTHGCLGVPTEFAARLFAAAKVGDEVFVLRRA